MPSKSSDDRSEHNGDDPGHAGELYSEKDEDSIKKHKPRSSETKKPNGHKNGNKKDK